MLLYKSASFLRPSVWHFEPSQAGGCATGPGLQSRELSALSASWSVESFEWWMLRLASENGSFASADTTLRCDTVMPTSSRCAPERTEVTSFYFTNNRDHGSNDYIYTAQTIKTTTACEDYPFCISRISLQTVIILFLLSSELLCANLQVNHIEANH